MMCSLSEGIYGRGVVQEKENVTRNLRKKGIGLSAIKIASSWTEGQIMKGIKKFKN